MMRSSTRRLSTGLLLAVVLLVSAACEGPVAPRGLESVSPDDDASPGSSSDAEVLDAAEVSEFAGIPIPDGATDVRVERVDGEIEESYRLLFTVPDGDADEICAGAGLAATPRTEPLDDADRVGFALPGDVAAEDVRQCQGMLSGEGVSRTVILVPTDGQVSVHAVAFLMPR